MKGWFRDGIVPVEIPAAKKGEAPRIFDKDEAIRPETTAEILARLKPAFKEGGTVTAGNAPGVSDGAAAVVVTSAETAQERGLKPMAVIRAQATAGREPEWFGLAPIDAVRKVARKAGWPLDSVDLFELNEAFSVQALAVNRELGLDRGTGQRPWRRGGAGASHRGQRGSGAGEAAVCHGAAREDARDRGAVPGRRQCGGAGRGAGLGRTSQLSELRRISRRRDRSARCQQGLSSES